MDLELQPAKLKNKLSRKGNSPKDTRTLKMIWVEMRTVGWSLYILMVLLWMLRSQRSLYCLVGLSVSQLIDQSVLSTWALREASYSYLALWCSLKMSSLKRRTTRSSKKPYSTGSWLITRPSSRETSEKMLRSLSIPMCQISRLSPTDLDPACKSQKSSLGTS